VRLLPHILLCCSLPFLAGGERLFAQHNDVPYNRDIYVELERDAAARDARTFTGLKPVIESRADLTHVMGYQVDSSKYYYWYTQKLLKESLFIVQDGDFRVAIDPLFRFEYGMDKGDVTAYSDTNRYYFNTRGFRIKGDLGNKISFQTMFHENQAIVPQYLFLSVRNTGVISGQGRVKLENRRKLDYGWARSSLSYMPWEWLNVQFGHGNHFVGHGYRSVLLSDHAINAPYLKFSALAADGRLQYTTWHTKLIHGVRQMDRLPTGDASESLFYWMRARYNHLALRLGRVELGLFEATIFRNIDEQGVRPFDALELNPVLGVNTLVNAAGGDHKSMLGLDMRVKVLDKAYVYGQFGTDDLGQQRHAWQAGLRLFDVVRKDLHVQLEYNAAQPFMYMHDPAQLAYMHAGLPLAHPQGTWFNEAVAIVEAGFGRTRLQGKVILATYHRDPLPEANLGTDLRKPDIPAMEDLDPLVRNLTFLDLNASYLVNPATNMRLSLGVIRRDVPGTSDNLQSTYFHVAWSTNLFNRYYDI
jgi:hypothetical protein